MEITTLCLPWFCTLLKTSSISHSRRLHFGQDGLFGLSARVIFLCIVILYSGKRWRKWHRNAGILSQNGDAA